MTQLPVQPAWRLADCSRAAALAGRSGCGPRKPSASSAASQSAANPSSPSISPSPSPPEPPACAASRSRRPGRVLLYPAEDALHVVRRRLEGICAAAGTESRRTRRPGDHRAQPAPRSRCRPRASGGNRRHAQAEAARSSIRSSGCIASTRMSAARSPRCSPSCANCNGATPSPSPLVHHARKGAGTIRAGQALRGSSEFHAWGDSNLYLRRDSNDRIVLSVEHRAAAAAPSVTLELIQHDDALALEPVQSDHQTEHRVEPTSVDQRITAALADGEQPRPFTELRASCRVRTTTLYERLAAMIAAGLVVKSADGYSLASR